jgi:hypothetical protein
VKPVTTTNQYSVIPAQAGHSTAELVIHPDVAREERKWIPASAGMTAKNDEGADQ